MTSLNEQGRDLQNIIGKCDGCFYYWEIWDDPGAQDCSLPSAKMVVDAGCNNPFLSLIDNEWPEDWGSDEALCPLWCSGYLYCGVHNELYFKTEGSCPACENDMWRKMWEDDLKADGIWCELCQGECRGGHTEKDEQQLYEGKVSLDG